MANLDRPWMLYGANGYTGRLIAREAVKRGMRPILAGRSRGPIEAMAAELNCPFRTFRLDSPARIADSLNGVAAVLHCAGPFSRTAVPMMDGCLMASVHYLDITGEIAVIEAAAARHQHAMRAGIAIMPAVGFDVVPTDCLAALLADELPGAVNLQLAFAGSGGFSPGTRKTTIEAMPHGGKARIDGRIQRVPTAWKVKEIPFFSGPRWAMTIPWGDVASAYYSTGIPNIEVYAAMPRSEIKLARRMRFLLPLVGLWPIQRLLKWWIGRSVRGPSEAELADSRTSIWGRVADADGNSVEATLETAGGYPLTVEASLGVLARVMAGSVSAGFTTPSRACGKDFVLSLNGTELRHSNPREPSHPARADAPAG